MLKLSLQGLPTLHGQPHPAPATEYDALFLHLKQYLSLVNNLLSEIEEIKYEIRIGSRDRVRAKIWEAYDREVGEYNCVKPEIVDERLAPLILGIKRRVNQAQEGRNSSHQRRVRDSPSPPTSFQRKGYHSKLHSSKPSTSSRPSRSARAELSLAIPSCVDGSDGQTGSTRTRGLRGHQIAEEQTVDRRIIAPHLAITHKSLLDVTPNDNPAGFRRVITSFEREKGIRRSPRKSGEQREQQSYQGSSESQQNPHSRSYASSEHAYSYPASLSSASGAGTQVEESTARPMMNIINTLPSQSGRFSSSINDASWTRAPVLQRRISPGFQCWDHGCDGRFFQSSTDLFFHNKEMSTQSHLTANGPDTSGACDRFSTHYLGHGTQAGESGSRPALPTLRRRPLLNTIHDSHLDSNVGAPSPVSHKSIEMHQNRIFSRNVQNLAAVSNDDSGNVVDELVALWTLPLTGIAVER